MQSHEDRRLSLIHSHNHAWKLSVGSAVALATGTGLVFVVYAKALPDALTPYAFLCALLLMACYVAFLVQSIRCPSCRLSLLAHAVVTRPATEWQRWLDHCRVCPQCGFSGTHRR